MKNLYEQAKKCFLTSDPEEKLQMSLQISSDWEAGLLEHKDGDSPIQFDRPGRLDKPPFVAVYKVKKRGFKSIQQRAALIHALTHIELTAVNLAWDSIYRYRGLPKEYYDDWVQTGKEESQHFYLLKQSLNEMGYDYGDFPVHDELCISGTIEQAKRLKVIMENAVKLTIPSLTEISEGNNWSEAK